MAYQRRQNVLSTMIKSNAKVKEILKERSLNMDDTDNDRLFGEKFEEKLVKGSDANQKSKSVLQVCIIKIHHLDHFLTVSLLTVIEYQPFLTRCSITELL